MSVQLIIKIVQSGGSDFPVDIDLTASVAELKEQIAGQAGIAKDHIRLVCAGKIWQDEATIATYEPRNAAIVHCLNNPPKAVPAASAQTLTPTNPMQTMMGGGVSPSAAATNGDPFAQMMAQSQQMMAQNPDLMSQLMDSPFMQQMMSNPETVRAMMRMNPQMEQLMEQRPEIARMLEDPETIRQSMEMMRNPALMREMQRNQDLALGHLDVMPGGHNALARAHAEILDPMMAALSGGQEHAAGAIDMSAYEQQAEGSPNNEALPNPWGAPTPATEAVSAAGQAPAALAPTVPMQPATNTAAGANPMAAMMQQMMNNPAIMQQSMQLMQNMNMNGGMLPTIESQTAVPPTPAPAANNPFAAMMAGGAPQAGTNTNPMAAMMQQMMSNPAMMQQSMQLLQNMNMNGGMLPMTGSQTAVPPTPAPAANNPFAAMMAGGAPQAGTNANPMAAMMQQMMSNPAMMQASMQMAQQMYGGAGGMAGGYPGVPDNSGMPLAQPLESSAARIQFANQLAQLSVMGFSNEAACLRALQQHQGRIDAAIDALLTSGDGGA